MKKNWINEHSTTPKYLQIVNAVILEIEERHLKKGDKLPSVNNLINQYDISRDTVVKAYEALKKQDIIDSVQGKGNYIKATNYKPRARIFLLFNKLSSHKKIIYDSFIATLGEDVSIDFYIYNNNFKIFKTILTDHLHKNYTHFVIIAHFNEGGENLLELLKKIPLEKLFILDKKIPGFFENYACVYQDFQRDIHTALSKAVIYIKKYKKIKIIFPQNSYHPKEILIGLKIFCQEYNFNYLILPDLNDDVMQLGDLYINLMESDLVDLIKKAKLNQLKIGVDVGIISYNETPLKEVLLDGITVISTDFEELGRKCASMILQNEKQQVANKFDLIVRNSL